MRIGLLILMAVLLTACSGQDESLVMQAELEQYGTEAANLRDQAGAHRTQAAATIEAAGTEAAAYQAYNQLLVATVRANIPPTIARQVINSGSEGGAMPAEIYNSNQNNIRLLQLGTAAAVPPDACFDMQTNSFYTNSQVIYLTGQALNVPAGSNIRLEWRFNGDIMYQNGFQTMGSEREECIQLAMTPADAPFNVGNWTINVYINGAMQGDPIPFTIYPAQ